MNTGALLPERGAGTSLTTVAARAGDRSSCSWRAGCGEIRKSGSEGSGEETTGRKAGIGASPLTLRDLRGSVETCPVPVRLVEAEPALGFDALVFPVIDPVWSLVEDDQPGVRLLHVGLRRRRDHGPNAACAVVVNDEIFVLAHRPKLSAHTPSAAPCRSNRHCAHRLWARSGNQGLRCTG